MRILPIDKVVRRRAIGTLAAVLLFLILEKAGAECHRHGLGTAAAWLEFAADLVKLELLVLLPIVLIGMSRPTLRRRAIFVIVVGLLFPLLQRAGIEYSRHGFALAGSCLISAANLLKPAFLVLLAAFFFGVTRRHPDRWVQFLLGVLCLPVFLISCATTVTSGRIILNASRPTRPDRFMRDQAAVGRLTHLANEMIQKQRITWVGILRDEFVFAIRHGNAEYRFDSLFIPKAGGLPTLVDAEDTSKVHHFLSQALKPTDRVALDPNDYAFCRRVNQIIRRIGFDYMALYPEHNVVRFEIYDFLGWDSGWRYVYYFCPAGNLPEEFKYERQLNAHWYYAQKPRFSD
jgi:hypothetical protein